MNPSAERSVPDQSYTRKLTQLGRSGPIPVEWDFSDLTIREAKPHEEHRWPGVNGH